MIFLQLLILKVSDTQDSECDSLCGGQSESLFCSQGCSWFRPEDSCHATCNFTASAQLALKPEATLACLAGCRAAADRYTEDVGATGGLPKPQIIADSVTATQVKIVWNVRPTEKPLGDGVFKMQARVLKNGAAGGPWFDIKQLGTPQESTDNLVTVSGLVPYAEYQFRVAWSLMEAEDAVLFSPPSKVVRMAAAGRPSPPILESVRLVRRLHVNVTWRPPLESRGPVVFYRLEIKEIASGANVKLDEVRNSFNLLCSG